MNKIKKVSIKEAINKEVIGIKRIYLYQSRLNQSDWIKAFEPYRSSYYAVAICIGGNAMLKVNLKEYKITKGDLIFVKNDDIKQWLYRCNDYETHTILFEKDTILNAITNSVFERDFDFFNNASHVFSLSKKQLKQFKELFLRFKKKSSISSKFQPIKLALNLTEILYEIAELELSQTEQLQLTRSKEILNQFIKLASTAVTQKRSLDYYSQQIGISKKHLSETIKAETNKTATQLLNEYLLLESKVLLKESTATVEEIAFQLHFSDASAFNKFFKRHTGLTPRKYRF